MEMYVTWRGPVLHGTARPTVGPGPAAMLQQHTGHMHRDLPEDTLGALASRRSIRVGFLVSCLDTGHLEAWPCQGV